MKNIISLFLFITFIISSTSVGASGIEITSPDHALQARFILTEQGELIWEVDYEGKEVLLPSWLGIAGYQENLLVKDVLTTSADSVWYPLYGERKVVADRFNGKTIRLARERSNDILAVEVRAYNEGLAFRYFFEENPEGGAYISIAGENTGFTFPEGTLAWHAKYAQAEYNLVPLKNWEAESERPLTLVLPNDLYACITEAQVVNYARTKFTLDPQKENTIRCSQYDVVDEITPFASPWRVLMVARKPGDLLANNDILLNLNDPCEIEHTWWIVRVKY
ncbi:MAG: glycoside hydrolase family 97 N-terminal domain-containing protein [Bacteroides sp.]|nr:glycoside hydrolase family 97 N-terminal domain-containing protein [Bacteroides sp.]